jgi:hypothetical protein
MNPDPGRGSKERGLPQLGKGITGIYSLPAPVKGRWLEVRKLVPWKFFWLLLVAVGAGVGSVAEACVPLRTFLSLRPASSGLSGGQVEVAGFGFSNSQVEVRWNSLDGPRLGTAMGPDFSVEVMVPEAPHGLYQVIAISRSEDGSIAEAATAAFLVTETSGADAGTGELSATPRSSGEAPPRQGFPIALWALSALIGGFAGILVGLRLKRRSARN